MKKCSESIASKYPEFSVTADDDFISVLVDEEKKKVVDVLGELQGMYNIRDMKLEEISSEDVVRKIYEEGGK